MSDKLQSLPARTALGAATPRVDQCGPLTLTENPNLALASVTARAGQSQPCAAVLAERVGDVPAPGKTAHKGDAGGFWIAPESWMLSAPFDPGKDLATELQARFAGTASITDQTDAWVVLDLTGGGYVPVMELLCPVDIRRMQPGDAQRTAIHQMGCFVIRPEPGEYLRILGPRSYAGSLHHALLTAMRAVA